MGDTVSAHEYIKFNAVTKGSCWIAVEGGGQPQRLEQGDCFLLPSRRPFVLACDLSLPKMSAEAVFVGGRTHTGVCNGGGDFSWWELISSSQEDGRPLCSTVCPLLWLPVNPQIRHRCSLVSLDRFERKIQERGPGASLIAKHLAHIMLIQVLRLHIASERSAGVGWLAALADPQLCAAMAAMHGDIARRWSLEELGKVSGMSRSGFASRFKQVAEISPMEYLARWRMHIAADRLRTTSHIICASPI